MTEKLMPCPQCKYEHPMLFQSSDGEVERVICLACKHEGPRQYSQREAITAWNTRHPTPAADEVEAVARALEAAMQHASIGLGWEYFAPHARAAIAAMQARAAEPAGEEGEFETLEEWEYEDQRELSLLYNHRYHDGPQFNRAQMRCAIRHGRRLGTTPTNPDRLVEAARIAAQELEASAPWCGEQAAGDILRAAAELRAALAPLKGEGE